MPSTLISIATYNRVDQLSTLLTSLEPVGEGVRIAVVDNDPAGSARETVARFASAEYFHEPKPGIVAARNRALDALDGEEFIAFVDDDEWVIEGWLEMMHACLARYEASVVVGPVIPIYPDDAPEWATSGEYFLRKRRATGAELPDAPTNNTLVRTSAILELDRPRFNDAFSDTGGSDTELFLRVKEAGHRIVWCDEAIAWEYVPASRITRAWVVQRQRRLGNVKGRLTRMRRPGIVVVGLGLAYIGYSTLRGAASVVRGRGRDSFADMRFWRGVGILDSLRGRLVREYER